MSSKLLNVLQLFEMHNLLLEADLKKIEESGIQIEHSRTIKKDELVDVELFDPVILSQARKMADFYVLYYSLENTIRSLISERLLEKYGSQWWDQKIPNKVKENVKKKQDQENQSVMSKRSDDPLAYTNFGELISILEENWNDFSDTIRSKEAMQQTLSSFNQIRNVIAHSCKLTDDEILRLQLLIKDWLRIQM